MTNRDRIEIDKKKEKRTKEISKMIGEGGLGADNYYNIKKETPNKKETKSKESTSDKENNEK